MIADGTKQRYAPHRRGPAGYGAADPAPRSEVLTIRFVRATDGHLSGALTPYWDPDRQCEATATFDGSLTGARMEGTFLSVCEGGVLAYRGRWTMYRKVPPAKSPVG